MRGRKNHGKRQALFLKRRQRYAKRTYRFDQSGKKRYNRLGGHPLHSRKTKWVMNNRPVKQHPVRFYVKRANPWPLLPIVFWHAVRHGAKGKRVPPWWQSVPTVRQASGPATANMRFAVLGKVRRAEFATGHKLFRLAGVDRQRAWARMFFWINGQAGYPAWDPDHRLPVFP